MGAPTWPPTPQRSDRRGEAVALLDTRGALGDTRSLAYTPTLMRRSYPDLHEHLDALRQRGLLVTVDRAIDKDAELHPLVRWQFVGGLPERDRRAFLFTNVTDGRGRRYAIPVVVGAIAANRAIYSVGMGAPVEEIQARWDHAIANPIKPRIVDEAVCQDVIVEGAAVTDGAIVSPVPFKRSAEGQEPSAEGK